MLGEMRRKIEQEFENASRNTNRNKIAGFERGDAYGHEAGMPIERWVKAILDEIDWSKGNVRNYFPNDFLTEIFSRIGKDERKIENALEQVWWAPLIVSPKQIRQFLNGQNIERWQQEGGDIILFYGTDFLKDISNVVLINVKSHDLGRASRPPNIMSAQRLLEYFADLLEREYFGQVLGKVNLWFLGVDYTVHGSVAVVDKVHIRDLFLLDLSKLPQINFDAAIQIQWHVRDMNEIQQDKLTFVENLAKTFISQWKAHSERKEAKYGTLVEKIKKLVKRMREISNS